MTKGITCHLYRHADAGVIPAEIGRLFQLKVLHLYQNELTGEGWTAVRGRKGGVALDKDVTLCLDLGVRQCCKGFSSVEDEPLSR